MNEGQLEQTFGKPYAELVRLADQHTLAVQAWLSSRSPHAVQVEGKGIKLSSTGLQVPLLNLALGCNFPSHATPDEISEEIEWVKAFFTKRGVPWLWWVGPHAAPANLTTHLASKGISPKPRKLPAMIAPADSHMRITASQNNTQVWRAKTEADLQAASTIRRKAFRFPPGTALHYFEDMKEDWLLDTSPARLYLAGKQNGSPAAIGAVIEGAGLPGIYIMATLPDYMRQGLGKAILAHLLQQIDGRIHNLVVLTASPYGFPLYAQFGFHYLFDYSIYALV